MTLNRETGYSIHHGPVREAFAAYRMADIDCLEISPLQSAGGYENLNLPALRALADEYEIRLNSFHLRFAPFQTIEISSIHEELRRKSVEYQAEFIRRGADVGIPLFVIHPSDEPILPENRAKKIALSKESLAFLARVAGECGVTVAVEDLPRTCLGNCSAELLDLISVDDRLRICFDTNHMLSESLPDFIRACGDKIVTTHFSDYDFKNERHWHPGEGDVDWVALMDALDEVGYRGPILYEHSLDKDLPSIKRSRPLTPADLKETHRRLEARLALTPFGVRTPDLPAWNEIKK